MGNREARARIAQETLDVLSRGSYPHSTGAGVDIGDAQFSAVAGTTLYDPPSVASLIADSGAEAMDPTRLDVENCTTFAGARLLLDDEPQCRPLCLNFASAKNPGGGFLGGSQAQEEALARASGLYPCLTSQTEYYERNRANGSSLYTDHMIYSPEVPVFRDDDDAFLDDPYTVSILTAPAPNAGAIRQNQPSDVGQIAPTMRRRIQGVLAIARHHNHSHLVLGAWGCGVFGNDPVEVAGLFREVLFESPFADAFERVFFAVLDHSRDLGTINAFKEGLAVED